MIKILCRSFLLSTLQSNMSLVGIRKTPDAIISVELPVLCCFVSARDKVAITYCMMVTENHFPAVHLLTWISLIVIFSSVLPCLEPSEAPHIFLVLIYLNGFMSCADFLVFFHSLLALLVLKDFIQVQASVVTVLGPLYPWNAHRNLKENWSIKSFGNIQCYFLYCA